MCCALEQFGLKIETVGYAVWSQARFINFNFYIVFIRSLKHCFFRYALIHWVKNTRVFTYKLHFNIQYHKYPS